MYEKRHLNNVLIEGVLVADVKKERKGPYRMTVQNVRDEKEFKIDLIYTGTSNIKNVRALKEGMVISAVGKLEYGADGFYIHTNHIEYKKEGKTMTIHEEVKA